jgi:hypothetical protein
MAKEAQAVGIGSLLRVEYAGWFMCRIATDPDPTNERLGVSGYTMALVDEPPLDQVIRLQPDAATVLREPAREMGVEIGVRVTGVTFGGEPYAPGMDALVCAPVTLEGKAPPFDGPIFDSRNNIVGSDDNMMFVVNPFRMAIRGREVTLTAVDHLDPANPDQPIWEIEDPAVYARRFPRFVPASQEVMAKLRVFDQFTYFDDRLRFLRARRAELEGQRVAGREDPELEVRIEGLQSRIYQIEFWGERVFNKLAFQLDYGFRVNGPQEALDPGNALRGRVDAAHPWLARFWFGGWDGDLLIGRMEGALEIPFLPDSRKR